MLITVTGTIGSGKSTICKYISENYGYEIFSTGTIHRNMAEEMGLTSLELNKSIKKVDRIDNYIDNYTKSYAEENEDKNIIFDSRMAFNFVKKAFNVFILSNIKISAERIFSDNRGKSEIYKTLEDCQKSIMERANLEVGRFVEKYGINYKDLTNYDLVIDSTYVSADEIGDMIMSIAEKGIKGNRILLNPESLFMNQNFRDINPDRVKEYSETKEYKTRLISVELDKYNNGVVIDGNHRWLSSIVNKEKFIEVNIKDIKDKLEFYNISNIGDVEDNFGIKYKTVPNSDDLGWK